MRSTLFAATYLALIHISDAQAVAKNEARDTPGAKGISKWLNRLTRRDVSRRQSGGTCYEDDYYYFVYNSSFGENFCQAYMHYPNVTITEDYTPTSTIYDISTITVTRSSIVRTTPGTTLTVTTTAANNPNKRDAQITPMARHWHEGHVAEGFERFRKQNSISMSNESLSAMSASFSSACSCQTYSGTTTTETYTDEAEMVTLSGYDQTTTTLYSTRIAMHTSTSTTTLTVMANPNTGATATSAFSVASGSNEVATVSSSSSTGPTPTAPPFTCPDDNMTTVSQMVSDERFDYQILCGSDIVDPTFFGSLYYGTFGHCVAACSVANKQFEAPVCQAVSFFNSVNNEGYNCFLKTGGNDTVTMVGTNSAVLLRIAVGISSNNAGGTNTETAPFTSETDSDAMSTLMSSMMSNSTTSMPILTPGPTTPPAASTYYSTYVLNGSTYSSGSVFSTYYTSNGSWYYSYYTSYTLNWASQTTEYEVTETGTSVSNSSNSSSQQQSNAGGGYSIISDTNTTTFYNGGHNVTEVISNQTFNANGSQIASTATTLLFIYTDSPREANISVSVFSTQTVITHPGNMASSGGSAGSGAVATPPPTAFSTGFSTGTAYSSGFVVSGGLNASMGSGGGQSAFSSGFAASGAITVTSSTSAFESAFSSGTAASGALTFTDTGVPRAGSGLPSPYGPPIPVNTNRTHRTEPIWTPPPYTNSEAPRSGSEDTTSSNIPLFTGASYAMFSDSGEPRGPGTGNTPTPRSTGTAFSSASSSMPPFTGPAYVPFTNTDSPRQGSYTSSSPFSNTDEPRQGSETTPCTSATANLGTTTIFSTTTVYGCYSYCVPTETGHHHDGPRSFGPGW